ncbi:MAG: hypothetical protein ACLQFI_09850 [Methylocella sp.]
MLNVIAFPNSATPERRAIYLRFTKAAPVIAWPAPAAPPSAKPVKLSVFPGGRASQDSQDPPRYHNHNTRNTTKAASGAR